MRNRLETGTERDVLSDKKGLDRRGFLKKANVFFSIAACINNDLFDKDLLGKKEGGNVVGYVEDSKSKPISGESGSFKSEVVGATRESEHASSGDIRFDTATAVTVTSAFMYEIGYGGLIKGHSLGVNSAIRMNTAFLGRQAALKLSGERGIELAKEEMHEYKTSLRLSLPLVLMSDLTTTKLNIDVDGLLGKVELEGEEKSILGQDLELSQPIEEWEKYRKEVAKAITEKVGEAIAVTASLAPLSTTYSSSAVANRLKRGLASLLFKLNYARGIIEYKLSSNNPGEPNPGAEQAVIDPGQERVIAGQAVKLTEESVNGPFGLSNLFVTLSANVQGKSFLGDPPEIFFLANNFKNPGRVTLAEGLGLGSGMWQSVALPLMWLKRNRVVSDGGSEDDKIYSEFANVFARSLGKTITKLVQHLVPNSELASAAFNNSRSLASRLEQALESVTVHGSEKKLRDVITRAARADVNVDFRAWWREKQQCLAVRLRALSGQNNVERILRSLKGTSHDMVSFDAFSGTEAVTSLINYYRKGRNASGLNTLLDRLSNVVSGSLGEQLAESLSGILLNNQANEPKNAGIAEQTASWLTREQQEKLLIGEVSRIFISSGSYDRKTSLNNLEVFARDEKDARKGEDFYKSLIDRRSLIHTVAESLFVTKGVEEEKIDHGKSSTLLGHSAQEVAYALGTQIPAVSSLARLASKAAIIISGSEKGRIPEVGQVMKGVSFILSMVCAISAFADNVAAFMFGENSLRQLYMAVYGDDVFKKNPSLEDYVVIAPLKLAEQAGANSKLGNGPNFSQQKLKLNLRDESGVIPELDQDWTSSAIGLGESLKNPFAAAGTTFELGAYIAVLQRETSKL